MHIKSIRYGFANNSSSSHSIVFLGDYKVQDNITGDFGWDYFTASSKESKQEYCFATLLGQRQLISYSPRTTLTEKTGWLSPFIERDILKKKKVEDLKDLFNPEKYEEKIQSAERMEDNMKWKFILENFSDIFGKDVIEKHMNSEDRWSLPSVDHQSLITLPINPDGSVQLEFAKNLFSILIDKNFAILGGNDNDDTSHELSSHDVYSDDESVIAVKKILNIIGTESGTSLCIYDAENDDFVLQNNYNGNKTRLSFNTKKETKKSSFPELVDLKITENCDYGCTFCYQSSTKEGKHGSVENIEHAIKVLAESGTMEIAIGGGEPTKHPNLLKILKDIRSYNMLGCFTTKNYDLHLRSDFAEILKTANSIAFSCNSVSEIKKVEIIQNASHEVVGDHSEKSQLYIQMIPELMTDKSFDSALEYIVNHLYSIPITLLGYKDFGFGENYKPKNRFANSNWIKTIKKYSDENGVKFGIDSVLVSKWKKELIENDVDPLALVGEEGKFSCYLDAVKMTIYKSSFSKEAGIQLTGQEKNIKEQFLTF